MTAIISSAIQIGTPFTYSSLASVSTDGMSNIAQSNTIQSNQHNSSSITQVNISPEAREKLAQEQGELGKKLAQQLNPDSTEDTKKSTSGTNMDLLDKLIEQIKEQIEEVQQELRKLNSDNSEQAQQEKKMLESQLLSRNGTL